MCNDGSVTACTARGFDIPIVLGICKLPMTQILPVKALLCSRCFRPISVSTQSSGTTFKDIPTRFSQSAIFANSVCGCKAKRYYTISGNPHCRIEIIGNIGRIACYFLDIGHFKIVIAYFSAIIKFDIGNIGFGRCTCNNFNCYFGLVLGSFNCRCRYCGNHGKH